MASTYPGTERFTVEFVPAVRAMARSRSAEPAEGEAVELPVEDVTVKSGEEDGHEENAPSEVTEASTAVPAKRGRGIHRQGVPRRKPADHDVPGRA